LPNLQPHWYVVHTRSNCEQKVALELLARKFEHYLPVFRELHQWKDRRKLVDLPLFPGYVFVRMLDSAVTRLEIRKIESAVRILGYREHIEPVAEDEIAGLKRLLSANGRCMAHPLLREGAWVRVKRGALEGLEGLLVGMKNHTRLVLSIELLSQSVSTEIDASDVEFLRSSDASANDPSRSDEKNFPSSARGATKASARGGHAGPLKRIASGQFSPPPGNVTDYGFIANISSRKVNSL
jgi:transcription antitermination factor NusG